MTSVREKFQNSESVFQRTPANHDYYMEVKQKPHPGILITFDEASGIDPDNFNWDRAHFTFFEPPTPPPPRTPWYIEAGITVGMFLLVAGMMFCFMGCSHAKPTPPAQQWYKVECDECNGKHDLTGQPCECGTGKMEITPGKFITCPLCRGTVKRSGTCPYCHDGYLYTTDGFVWRDRAPPGVHTTSGYLIPCIRDCSDCNGTGHYKGKGCNLCAPGGEYEHKWCPVCGNLGNYEGPCHRCDATGKVKSKYLSETPPK